MLRQRKVNVTLKAIKELDAFSKFEEKCCVEKSPVGGSLSVISFVLILWLLYSEFNYWLDSQLRFKFSLDTDFDAKLPIHIDMTVAMPCNRLGADILDSTNQNVFQFGALEEEDTWFELTTAQRRQFDSISHINSYLREEYHAVQELLWKSGQSAVSVNLPKRTSKPEKPYDACRFHGTLSLNKVAGNFHITAGKSIALPRGHIHINAFMSDDDYNFTHRINRFGFGHQSPGILHPLEGDEKYTSENMMLFQYFIEVVPTSVETMLTNLKTYQYSVKEHLRPVDHDKGSHGIPGIFFKYDVSPLQVNIIQERDNVITFVVRLFSTVAGIHICAGLINSVVLYFFAKKSHNEQKDKKTGSS